MPNRGARRALSRTVLGDILRALRTRRGLTQESLSELAGIDRSYVGRLENGKARATIEIVHRLLWALDASWHEFADAVESG